MNDIETFTYNRDQEKDKEAAKKLDKKIEKLRHSLEIEQCRLDVYNAEKDSKADPKSKTKKNLVEQLKSKLDTLRGGSSKDDKTSAPKTHAVPHIRVSETNGNVRSATGFSSMFGGHSRARM